MMFGDPSGRSADRTIKVLQSLAISEHSMNLAKMDFLYSFIQRILIEHSWQITLANVPGILSVGGFIFPGDRPTPPSSPVQNWWLNPSPMR